VNFAAREAREAQAFPHRSGQNYGQKWSETQKLSKSADWIIQSSYQNKITLL